MKTAVTQGFRLSPQQQHLWRVQGGVGHSAGLVTQCAVGIDGPLDARQLRLALEKCIERHEVLRTTFHLLPGMTLPVQVVGETTDVRLRGHDLAELTPGAWDEAVEGLLAEDRETPFDLANGPLLRAALVGLGPAHHALLLSMPSVAADGVSLLNLTAELAAGYAGAAADEEVLQYADSAEILHEWLDAAQEAPDSYWRHQDLATLSRPGRSAVTGVPYRPGVVRAVLSGALMESLEGLAGRLGAPVSRLLLALWQATIFRSTGEGRVVVGTAFDGRTCAEFETALGPFSRILPIGADLDARTSLRELGAALGDRLSEAGEWQDGFPLETVDSLLGADGRAPRWELGFDFQKLPAPLAAGPVRFSVRALHSSVDRFDLRLLALQGEGWLRLDFSYDEASVERVEAERLKARFLRLLDGVLETADAPLAELDALGEDERRELLADFNHTARAFAEEGLAHELFAAAARRRPEAVAIVADGVRLTYAELADRSGRLARRLHGLGVGPESRVGLCLPRSPELVEAILGVLEAGGVYVPLDPGYPAERLAFMAGDAGLAVLLTTEALRPLVPFTGRVVCLDTPAAEEASGAPLGAVGAENAAYVIYTSGSTGRPKGVVVPHRGLANYLLWARESYCVADGGGAPVHSPIGFDLTVTSLLAPLVSGAAVTLLPEKPGVETLAAALAGAPGYGLVKITPAHLEALRHVLPPAEHAGAAAVLVIGGEALWADTLALWREHAPATRLINEYGPTEATVGCCVYEVAAQDPGLGPVAIGRPIANTRLYVVGPGRQPVPAGAPGELWIGGGGLARGYLRRPDITAERFVPDPFGGEPGARLYRTGDLVRHRSDGNLEYLGRIDDQVKIRGHRIEPGEVEAALADHPGVGETAVVARDSEGGKRLVAYVVPRGERPAASDLRAFLGARLPEHMVPSAFVTLERLPLTPNGKLDRRALPEPSGSEEAVYAAPRTLTEGLLAEIWARVLGVTQVGIDDPFFSLGGDSIRSIQVLSLAQERGISLTLQDLFQRPTIRGLAERALESAERQEVGTAPFSLVPEADREQLPGGLEDAYPLSRLQAGMVFHSAYNPGSAVYNDLHSFHLRGRFDAALMTKAVEQVTRRHAALRTSFDLSSFGQPMQLVHLYVAPPVSFDDLRQLPAEGQAAEVAAWLDGERLRGFDWGTPPLVRFHIHRRTEESFQFTLSFHHSVLDGWSAASLLTELFRRYTALLDGEDRIAMEPPGVSLRDFVALERSTSESAEARDFWARHLDGSTFVRLPRRSAPGGRPSRAAEVEVPVPVAISDGLKALARAQAVPIKSVLLAAHFRVLSLLAGQPDVLGGVVANGRPERADGDQVLGLFLNTLPLRLRLDGGTWAELAQAAFELERESLGFRRFPLADLQRMEGGRPLFEIAFNFLHYHVYQSVTAIAGLDVLERAGYEETNFLFTVHFQVDPGTSHVRLLFNFQESELEAEEVAAVGRYYQAVLAAMAENPEGRYETAPLLPAAELSQVLVEWNGAAGDLPTEPIHRVFERRTAERPESVAVTCEGRSLTYGELNARANRLARRLRVAGVGPEVPVAVALERSPEMVIALLAVLKAGGAYVPLDPAYPAERLAFILADARTPLLLAGEGMEDALPEHGVRVIRVEDEMAEAPIHDLPESAGADNLAYVIYTSGSTGRPKGVQVTHANVSRLLTATEEWFDFGPGDVWTLFHSYAFDFSVWEMWGALLYGGRLVVVPHPVTRSPEAFHDLLASEGVTVLNQTPSAFRQLSAVEDDSSARAGRLATLRAVIFGGEALDVAALRTWIGRYGTDRPRLVNMYGITETTVHVTRRMIAAADLDDSSSPIGGPIPDLRLYLLDPHGQPVPVGVPGELHVGGAGVARGYLGRPGLTATRFIPDPFSGGAGARLYRSGDLARYRPDGGLEYLGRADDQVKIRGFRIELGEIEAALLSHPSLREAVVLARADGPGERRLVAYVVPAADARPAVEEIRAFLRQRLPEHMLPAAMVTLGAFPLTANGKIDRRALPPPSDTRPELEQELVAPRGEVEATLCRIWSEVLRLAEVGVHDNFFALGGDSILSIQVTTRAQRAGITISPRLLFQHPTVAELAAAAETAQAVRAEQGQVTGPVPLTPIQRWFFDGGPAEPDHYNQSVLFATARPLSPAPLAVALARLTEHHDALRLRFRRAADGWEQEGTPVDPAGAPLLQIDLSALPEGALAGAVNAVTATAQASLDITAGPLQRAALIDLGPERPGRFFWAIHHLAVDGVSWRILLEDLATVYGQIEGGLPTELPAKTTSFRRWSEILTAYATTPELAAELDFWRGQSWWDAAPLPVDGTGANTVAAERSVSLTLDTGETLALLQEVPQAYGTQINDALLTALTRAVQSWTGYPLLVDLEGHGREEIAGDLDLSRTVGWFTTIYPVLLDLRRAGDPGAALREVKERLRGIPGNGLGYGVLRHLSANGKQLAGLPRAEMTFNYLGQLDQTLPGDGPFRPAPEPGGSPRAPRDIRRHLLDWNGGVFDGRLHLTCTYGEGVHRRETIERLVTAVGANLRELIEHCRAPEAGGYTPSDFPLAGLDQSQIDKVLASRKKVTR